MSLRPIEVTWRSHVEGHASPGGVLPAELATPAAAWDYGAVSEPLGSDESDGVLALTLQATQGVVGVAVLALNYGVLLTREAVVHPNDGERTVIFAFPRSFGSCRLLLRTYDDAGPGRARVFSAQVGARSDLPPEVAQEVFEAAAVEHAPALTDEMRAWSSTRDECFTPISLGNSCEAKFQIARTLQFRREPGASELAFRLAMLPPIRAADRFGWELFDWQGTSLKAILSYLSCDFEGVFERADLHPAGGGVKHGALGTEHMHDFEFLLDHPAALVTPQIVDTGYPAARARFDAMAQRFREILRRPGPFLYVHVCEDIPSDWDVLALAEALRARAPEHRFRLLFVGMDGSDTPWGEFASHVADKAFRPRTWSKPAGREWEGPDAAWDAALAPYQLAFPDGSAAGACAGEETKRRTV